jgi:CheY-like chemotaxis protein
MPRIAAAFASAATAAAATTVDAAGDGKGNTLRASYRPEANERRRPRLDGLRLLVVEDEADARDLLQEVLDDAGATTHTAASAADGFDEFCRIRPHVVLSDIGMPGEDGYSFMRRIRALGPQDGGDVPAIALTAFTAPDDKEAAAAAGFTVHLGKPVSLSVLIAAIARLSPIQD